ncbi:MAG: alpha/beta fold hydrolase [Pseudomonadota bacterium]
MSRLPTLRVLSLVMAITTAACVDLDSFQHGGLHCSAVGPGSCDVDSTWGKICKKCDEPYDWQRDYPWVDGTSARPITDAQQLQVPTRDGLGTLDGYFIPSHGGNAALAGTTVLYSHGNYRGIEHYQPRVRFLHEAGFGVLVYDYRGYGKTDPASYPTGEQFFDDAESMRAQLDSLGVDSARVVYYGYSLGALPTVELAQRKAPCALILEAPYPSADIVIEDSSLLGMPASYLGSGDYDNERKLSEIHTPLLILHGSIDDAFTVRGSERLRDAAAGPVELRVVEGASHGLGDGVVETLGTAAYFDIMESFLQRVAPECL